MNPAVSVIMGVYKEPIKWLHQSVESVLCQTFTDFEFIIIIDNPNYVDGISVLENYATRDKRIVLIKNDTNIGLTKSLNKGLRIAKGKYIARMDADDISLPKRFQMQFDYMEEHPEIIVLGTNIMYIGNRVPFKGNDSIKFTDSSIKAQMLLVNCIAHSSVFIRKKVLTDNSIEYDEGYRQSQDYRMWELLRSYGKFAVLPARHLRYRVSEQQITKSQTHGQANLAGSVRFRLQKNWLIENGVNFTDKELEESPFRIIERLRHNRIIKKSLEYKAFLQYAYLLSGDKNWAFRDLLLHDMKNMPLLSVIRLFIRNI